MTACTRCCRSRSGRSSGPATRRRACPRAIWPSTTPRQMPSACTRCLASCQLRSTCDAGTQWHRPQREGGRPPATRQARGVGSCSGLARSRCLLPRRHACRPSSSSKAATSRTQTVCPARHVAQHPGHDRNGARRLRFGRAPSRRGRSHCRRLRPRSDLSHRGQPGVPRGVLGESTTALERLHWLHEHLDALDPTMLVLGLSRTRVPPCVGRRDAKEQLGPTELAIETVSHRSRSLSRLQRSSQPRAVPWPPWVDQQAPSAASRRLDAAAAGVSFVELKALLFEAILASAAGELRRGSRHCWRSACHGSWSWATSI